jgi:hypothetical protein
MKETFRVRLFTRIWIADLDQFRPLWKHLADPLVGANRFDSSEPPKQVFDPALPEAGFSLLERHAVLIVRGKDGLNAMFRQDRRGVTLWTVQMNMRALSPRRQEDWLRWHDRLVELYPVAYGFGASKDEENEVHVGSKDLPDGTSASNVIGLSLADFVRSLPGVHWMTIFGTALIEDFGRRRLCSLPGTRARELPHHVILILNDPIQPDDMAQRIARVRDIEHQLGSEYFLSSATAEPGANLPPRLRAELRQCDLAAY